MTGFGVFWIILWCVLPIVFGIWAGCADSDEETGFVTWLLTGFVCMIVLASSLCSTYPDEEDCFEGGYFIPNKQAYNLYVEQDGTVEIQQIFSVQNGKQNGRFHFFIKDDTGQRISYTCPNTVPFEEYDDTPIVEIAYSYQATGQMKGSSRLFWKDNEEHHIIDRGCPKVLVIYLPRGTKIKTALEQ